MPRWISTAQRNGVDDAQKTRTSIPSPVVFTMRPRCSVILGSTRTRRCNLSCRSVPSSSVSHQPDYSPQRLRPGWRPRRRWDANFSSLNCMSRLHNWESPVNRGGVVPPGPVPSCRVRRPSRTRISFSSCASLLDGNGWRPSCTTPFDDCSLEVGRRNVRGSEAFSKNRLLGAGSETCHTSPFLGVAGWH